MKKVECHYCGILNFEKVSICFNCKKTFSRTIDSFSQMRNQSFQNQNNFKSIDLKSISKTLFVITLLGITSIAAFCGKGIYYSRLENQKNMELEKQNKELIEKEYQKFENFQRLQFDPDISSTEKAFLKLPPRFRINPPDLETINRFPFRKKVVTKIKPVVIATGYEPSSPYAGQVIGRVGNATLTTGGQSGGGTWTKYSKAEEVRMLKVKKIQGYTYSKNSLDQLLVNISFIGEFQRINRTGNEGSCPDKRIDCVESRISEGRGMIRAKRVGDDWEINLITGSARYIQHRFEWNKETEHLSDKNNLPDLIPNWESPEIFMLEDDRR